MEQKKLEKSVKIRIQKKLRKTIIDNGNTQWSWTNVDDITALASVVFYTMKSRFEQNRLYSDDFSIKITIEECIK